MKHIPIALIYTRLLLGFIIIACSMLAVPHYPALTITLLAIGLLTDIFDGIIARKLNISSQKLRRLDSTIDQIFFICVGIATFIQRPAFFKEHAVLLIILFATEAAAYLFSYLKFRKEIATHSIGAKLWTLLLFATLIQVIAQGHSSVLFLFCFWLGMLTRLEIIAIIFTLKVWTNDVPSVYHAVKLRHGKEIRRNKLFNG